MSDTIGKMVGWQVLIRGIVQGVGFRPFVYNLAVELGLTGWVKNSSRGVEIEVNGPEERVREFLDRVQKETPPLARIDQFEAYPTQANPASVFRIEESQPQPGEFLPVSPDVAVCPDCQREMFDPHDRRFRYPFINCTNCGPRFTIVKDIPYDRPNTTMASFPLCPDCQAEYDDPTNRRFHAQPVACPVCGPQVMLEAGSQGSAQGDQAIQMARQLLRQGKVLAVKGLGGYHLACDAGNAEAVQALRERKRRNDKPFALMAYDLEGIKSCCQVTPADEDLLLTRQRPIVLLPRLHGSMVVDAVAPHQKNLGVMLAYTPLHLLLLEPEPGFPWLLVMTSGNLSEEPIAYDDDDARTRLAPLADAFLLHNRPIHMRVDDSVARNFQEKPSFMRRARGYAPDPLTLAEAVPPLLATGAELKNTFCLTRQKYAFISHHIGDMENLETYLSFEEGIEHYQRLFRIHPEVIACDLHPNYLATRYAQERADREGIPLVQVQHHHAHLAACLAENHWTSPEPVIGLTFDGTGYGTDGAVWGGEVLLGGYTGFERIAHLAYVPLPGGDLAIRKPARMALAYLWGAGMDWEPDLPPVRSLCEEERTVLLAQLEHGLNAPPTSSIGRLFDAVSALVGVRQSVRYEGQAAIELEAAADPDEQGAYAFRLEADIIHPKPVLDKVLADWREGNPVSRISARFHNAVANLVFDICQSARRLYGVNTVAISGGVWQNQLLLQRVVPRLEQNGFHPLLHTILPPNDGCLSLGQALIAAHTIETQP
jgi:hydrogenase maturation protein HypF